MLKELFNAIDRKDTEGFLAFLSADCVFRFGNIPAVTGTEAIREFVGGFFDSITGLSHDIQSHWATADGLGCHGMVRYTRRDGTALTVPFAVVLKTRDGMVSEYLIFADASRLYES